MLRFTSYNDLVATIRKNLWKIPRDIDYIVGVPRSGMMVAIILSEYLNIPVRSLHDYIVDAQIEAGGRSKLFKRTAYHRILVIDDTVFSGLAMSKTKAALENINLTDTKLYACVYAEGKNSKDMVDIYLEDNYTPNLDFHHLYEWNILHHGISLSTRTMYDMDGVLCLDPPDERDSEAYQSYLPNAKPLYLPSKPIDTIATYRLEKYRTVTEQWLRAHGVQYKQLCMTNYPDYISRKDISPATFKSRLYAQSDDILFVESNPSQAMDIFINTQKAVYCPTTATFYSK